ncbi:hypothetical protein [Hydrogenimonas sp.]
MGREEIRLFQELYKEAGIHRQRIEEARRCLQKDPESVPCMDQMIYRFSKLQDTMGRKLFRALLDAVGEWESTMTMVDSLNKLDKYEILDPALWQRLRDIRNEIAHNYEDDVEATRKILSDIEASLPLVDKVMENLERFARMKGVM